jgi:hypothetical protein
MKLADLSGLPKWGAENFLSHNPTEIASVHGVTFYEDPKRGDGVPLWAVVGEWAYLSDAWDAGDLECDSGIFTEERG